MSVKVENLEQKNMVKLTIEEKLKNLRQLLQRYIISRRTE